MKKSLIFIVVSIFLVALVSVVIYFYPEKAKVEYIYNKGETQGTTYSITYLHPDGVNLQAKIEERLHEFDLSLSTYNPNSIISKINNNDSIVKTDSLFETVFYEAQKVSAITNGALDITVGPLVKAWGFAFGNSEHTKLPNVADFMPYIGYEKVRIENHKLIKKDPRILIDANSIAQGFSVDVIAKLLRDNSCENYMVEIGGEILCKGLNPKGVKWNIGIDKAIDDATSSTEELQTIISITDCAITTAGGYRKFFIKDGKKYSHIINPKTGFPVSNNVLSVTILAPTALMADAYDTPFMVLGVDSALKVCKRVKGLECYLIYADKNGKPQVVYTDGFKKYIKE